MPKVTDWIEQYRTAQKAAIDAIPADAVHRLIARLRALLNEDRQLFCFGKNDQHQASPTSNSATIDPSAATAIALPKTGLPSSVFARAAETCIVDTDGLLFCFGAGHGTNIDEITSVKDVVRYFNAGLPQDAEAGAANTLTTRFTHPRGPGSPPGLGLTRDQVDDLADQYAFIAWRTGLGLNGTGMLGRP